MNSRGLASSLLFYLGLVVLSVHADADADAQYNFQYPGNILPYYYPNPYQHFRQGVASSDVIPAPAIIEKLPSKNVISSPAISETIPSKNVISTPTVSETIPSDQKELSIDSSLSLIPSLESSTDLSAGDGKVFWTVTLTVYTSTSYSTFTYTTYCTTSTAALKVCTPSGRRKRSVGGGRGLYYDEVEAEHEDGNIFLPFEKKLDEPVEELNRVARKDASPPATKVSAPIPYVVQPGFDANLPDGAGRFLVQFGTTTTVLTTTSTYIGAITAICASTTSFQLCGYYG